VTRGNEPLRFRWLDQIRAAGSGVSALGRHTAHELARYMDAEGLCFPAQRSIAEAMARSDRQVRRGLDELELEGFLDVTRSKPNRYRAILKPAPVSALKEAPVSALTSKPAPVSALKPAPVSALDSKPARVSGTTGAGVLLSANEPNACMHAEAGEEDEPAAFAELVARLESVSGRRLNGAGRAACLDAFAENEAGLCRVAADVLERGERNPLGLLVRMVSAGEHRLAGEALEAQARERGERTPEHEEELALAWAERDGAHYPPDAFEEELAGRFPRLDGEAADRVRATVGEPPERTEHA